MTVGEVTPTVEGRDPTAGRSPMTVEEINDISHPNR